ncbi:MAG: hypothetical protein RLZZ306_2781 [Bacteroidota bacterium]
MYNFVPQSKRTQMVAKFHRPNLKNKFSFDEWIQNHIPKWKYTPFWEEINSEYHSVVDDFEELLKSKELITDKDGNILTPADLYNLINEYKIRIEKLMLIYNIRLYKTLNENKRSGIKYIVMRAFWIDHLGKNVKWFSRNIGPENKVLVNDQIPVHALETIEEDILHLMWGQYQIEYLGAEETGVDYDGNTILVDY